MNYSARERFAQLMQSQGQAMAAPMQGTRSSQMLSAVRMAEGGEARALPTLQEMANPNYQFQGVQLGANAPFTQFNPVAPMFSLEAPAFGGMDQSTYDFTAPIVQGGQLVTPPRGAPVMTESTSAYRPVDATTVMDPAGNIPNVPSDPYAPPDPYTFVDPNTPAPYVPPVAQTQPVPQPTPPISQPTPVTPPIVQPTPVTPPGVATTGTSIPTVITADERAAREAAGIQAELERRQAAEQAAREAAAQAEAQRLQEAEQERLAAAAAQAKAEADARAFAERIAAAAADKNAQIKKREDERIAAEAAAAQAERDRIAAEQAAQAERDRIAAAQAADPRIQYLRDTFGLFGGTQAPAPAAPTYDVFGNEDPGPDYYESLNQEGA